MTQLLDPHPKQRPSRRGVLALAAAGAGAAIAGVAMVSRPTRDWVHAILAREFGEAIVSSEAAERYIAAMSAKLDGQANWRLKIKRAAAARFPVFTELRVDVENEVITEFLKRTNVYRVVQGGDSELEFASLDPYEAGCSNYLAAPFKIGGNG